jgi:dihydroxyacid dehydratase/phosphogluconate dehydratase
MCGLCTAGGCIRAFVSPHAKNVAHIMGSANTMSSALEVLGISLPYSSSTPALYAGSVVCHADE